MKNKNIFLLSSALAGGIIFNALFWKERIGINLLLYSIFILAIHLFNKDFVKTARFKLFALANCIAAVLVVVNNSSLSILTYYTSLLFFIGYAHYPQIRSVFTAGLAAWMQLIMAPISVLKKLSEVKLAGYSLRPFFKLLRYISPPAFIFFVFLIIYANANEVFGNYLELSIKKIEKFLTYLLRDIDLPRVLHCFFGVLITAGLTITFFNHALEKAEAKCRELLTRVRRHTGQATFIQELASVFTGKATTKKLALKTENITGVISFWTLNLLILTINIIDIKTLWLGNKPTANFSADLHDGTNALIFSTILAMAVILFFFRGNLNFYSKNRTLKTLAYVWMIQNFVLIVSVWIRDIHYIDFYGLTHKRIGVLIFVLLCTIGLYTVYIKVAKQKTLFFLFKINGYIWFALLMIFSGINWDIFIVKYNLAHADTVTIDTDYLLTLSDKTLPVLDQNRARLYATQNYTEPQATVPENHTPSALARLDRRIGFFKERYENVSWLSWNLQDWNTAAYFKLENSK